MRYFKKLVAGRLRAGLVLVALGATALGASGCILTGDYVVSEQLGKRLGEQTATSGGLLVVLYRTDGGRSYNFPTSEVALSVYRNYRTTHNVEGSSVLTLRLMRSYCGGGYTGDRCRDATADDEWQDFYGSLSTMAGRPGECLAVQVRSGEDWQTRNSTDSHCIPN
jgi:hypothetical protein